MKTSEPLLPQLSRRERQIMDAIYRVGQATAADVMQSISDPPGYSAVRALLRVLEEKGHLTHEEQGPRYVYRPTVARDKARRSALERLIDTFFDGSTEQVFAALLDLSAPRLSEDELERISRRIEDARKEGK
jgi:predicted transcriptional regulator